MNTNELHPSIDTESIVQQVNGYGIPRLNEWKFDLPDPFDPKKPNLSLARQKFDTIEIDGIKYDLCLEIEFKFKLKRVDPPRLIISLDTSRVNPPMSGDLAPFPLSPFASCFERRQITLRASRTPSDVAGEIVRRLLTPDLDLLKAVAPVSENLRAHFPAWREHNRRCAEISKATGLKASLSYLHDRGIGVCDRIGNDFRFSFRFTGNSVPDGIHIHGISPIWTTKIVAPDPDTFRYRVAIENLDHERLLKTIAFIEELKNEEPTIEEP